MQEFGDRECIILFHYSISQNFSYLLVLCYLSFLCADKTVPYLKNILLLTSYTEKYSNIIFCFEI